MMNTMDDASHHLGEVSLPSATQLDLFGDASEPTEAGLRLFADIVFDRPLDHAYSYAVPPKLSSTIAVGKRVQAPFGRGDKSAIGFCVGVRETPPGRTVKELRAVLDDEALLTPNLLRLTRWMADYYLCGWGQVLNAVVPAGAKKRSGTREVTFLEAVAPEEAPDPPPTLSGKQSAALEQLRRGGRPLEPRTLARLARCGPAVVAALVLKGLARRVVRRVDRYADSASGPEETASAANDQPTVGVPLTLTADQLGAWQPIELALREGGFRAFLLHGVTGSGKTELYLRAIDEVIRQGKEALVLVPEISLTPQAIESFRGRVGEAAVLHSHLGNAERGRHWRRIAGGQVPVVVGARSAVFAPARKLGLIVVDEEHEGSFKQESTPRYHARDVAVMRARLEGIPIILGSATPSLESWHNAERGQYTLLRLPSRVLDRPLPRVSLIDVRHEPVRRGRYHALSPTLERAMHQALAEGGQVILLLNRRGFSTHVHCPSCGRVEFCRFCDLALTYHRERAVLLCHYCGYEMEPPELCAACGQTAVRYQGLGTEKLQAEIEEKFAGYEARRMDSDTMKRPGSHGRVLAAFGRGEIQVLFGTQMIAKGLDFPNVTLVGVVNADVGLHLPDFRSAERTFQLLAQVAGRTGRGPRGGRVLVQTFNPEQPCIALAARHDFERFAASELSQRRAHNYPPYNRLVRLIVRSRKPEEAAGFADRLAGAFRTAVPRLQATEGAAAVRILGPAEAPVFRLKGYARFHFQLQSPSSATLHQLLRAVLPSLRAPSGVELTVDVDPLNML
jgi:primosomal protein N' (replication factor Y)